MPALRREYSLFYAPASARGFKMNEWEKLAKTIRVLLWVVFIGAVVAYGYGQIDRAISIDSCRTEILAADSSLMVNAERDFELCLQYGIIPGDRASAFDNYGDALRDYLDFNEELEEELLDRR